MIKGISLALASTSVFAMLSCSSVKAQLSEEQIDKKVDELMSKMSIEEKAGQMTQINLGVIWDKKNNRVDPQKLSDAINKYKVGSILNAPGLATDYDTWNKLVTDIQTEALKTGNKIPVLYGVDAIHGPTYIKESALFPHNLALGASRNRSLAKSGAKATAKQTRASGVRWNFDPVLDIGRQPLWPRFPETFGEDSYLISEMGVATILGFEEDGLHNPSAVASCMKHYVGYSGPENGKDRTPAFISDYLLWEQYLPQFQAAVKAGAETIMINSASINGEPVHASKKLLVDILRDSLGFEGMIVTDWEDIIRLHTRHNVAETPSEAVRQGVMAGLDMSMVPNNYSFYELLVPLIKSGKVPEKRVDVSVRRILKLKYKLGLFKDPFPEKKAQKYKNLPEYDDLAMKAARESIVLLENKDRTLPLSGSEKILVAGPTGNSIAALNGCWSFSWQGKDNSLYPKRYVSIAGGLLTQIKKSQVTVLSDQNFDSSVNYDTYALTEAAKGVDVILLCLGENAYAESPGAIDDLTLPRKQLEYAKAAYATGKKVVLVLAEGRPRVVKEIVDGADAILLSPLPGSKGGEAIAEILFGKTNPSAILPFSYPQYTGDITPYDCKVLSNWQQLTPGGLTLKGYKPQWPFGYGLSYTTFSYSDITLSKTEFKSSESVTAKVTIKNTGKLDGKVAVDMYIRDMYASLSPSTKKLKGFQKVDIAAGASKEITFTIDKTSLQMVNKKNIYVVEPGDFKVMIGDKSASFKVTE